jgi:DNA topoisomerase-3
VVLIEVLYSQCLHFVLMVPHQIDPELVLPTMRSAVEEQLNLIAQGQADFDAVLRHTVEIFKLKFLYFVKNIDGMDQLFEVSFSPLATSGKAHSRLVLLFFHLRV